MTVCRLIPGADGDLLPLANFAGRGVCPRSLIDGPDARIDRAFSWCRCGKSDRLRCSQGYLLWSDHSRAFPVDGVNSCLPASSPQSSYEGSLEVTTLNHCIELPSCQEFSWRRTGNVLRMSQTRFPSCRSADRATMGRTRLPKGTLTIRT